MNDIKKWQEEFLAYVSGLNLPRDDFKGIMGYIEEVPAQPEITDEQAVEHLQSTGWMQNHDREMYESGLREQLADDSGSYDSLIPCEDTISRQAAIDEIRKCRFVVDAIEKIRGLPSAEPEIIRCGQCKYAEVADSEDSQDGYTCQFHRGSIWFSGSYCSWAERRQDG